MIGHYPFVIVALLLIHSHSTNQAKLVFSSVDPDLRRERPIYKKGMTLGRLFAQDAPFDIVCDRVTAEDKESMCDQATELLVHDEWGIRGGSLGSFVNVESDLEVPQLAKSMKAYTCAEIEALFDHVSMKREMYWCKNRRYKTRISDDVHQMRGFFIMGSRLVNDKVFIFRTRQMTDQVVTPVAKIESVELLLKYAPGSSSSSRGNQDDH